MKTKGIQFIPTAFALVIIGFRYATNWCINFIPSCYGSWVHQIALNSTKPAFLFSIFLLPLCLILIFVPRYMFNAWLKFVVWALPLSIYYIATTSINFTGIGLDLFPFYRDDAARLAAEIFSVASLIVLTFRFMVLRLVKEKGREGEYQVRELKALVSASIALIASIVFSLTSNSSNWFEVPLLSGIVFVLATLFSLYQIVILIYKKKQDHLALGLKLNVAMLLVAVSVIVCATSFLIGMR